MEPQICHLKSWYFAWRTRALLRWVTALSLFFLEQIEICSCLETTGLLVYLNCSTLGTTALLGQCLFPFFTSTLYRKQKVPTAAWAHCGIWTLWILSQWQIAPLEHCFHLCCALCWCSHNPRKPLRKLIIKENSPWATAEKGLEQSHCAQVSSFFTGSKFSSVNWSGFVEFQLQIWLDCLCTKKLIFILRVKAHWTFFQGG